MTLISFTNLLVRKMKTADSLHTEHTHPRKISGTSATKLSLIAMMLIGLFALPVNAIPEIIDFQGKLSDSLNAPQTGVFPMYFSIYNKSSGGTLLWQENRSVSVSSGLFSILLGSTNPINLTFSENYFIEVNVSGETFIPRYRLATVPYAFRANISESAMASSTSSPSFIIRRIPGQNSNLTEWRNFSGNVISYVNVDGQFVGAFVGDGSQLTGVGLVNATKNLSAANITAETFGASVGGGSYTFPENLIINRNFTVATTLFVSELLGRLGIGTATPSNKLDVNGTVNAHSFLINGTPVLNGTVSGSGTTGYIPQFQSSGVINNSIIYQNGTSIGIGTVNPSTKLDVSGSANIGGSLGVTYDTEGATGLSISVNPAGSSPSLSIGTLGIKYLVSSNTLSSQNIGILGTTSNTLFGNSQTLYGFNNEVGGGGSGDSYGIYTLMDRTEAGTRYAYYADLTGSGNEYSFYSSSSNGILYNGGKVGIGTTNASALLEVNGTNRANNLSLNINNTLYVNGSSNNVGIGTSSPVAKLQINGNQSGIRFAHVSSPESLYSDIYVDSGGHLAINTQGGITRFGSQLAQYFQYYALASNGQIGWTSYTNNAYVGLFDIGLARNDVGILEVNDGTKGNYRDLKLRALNPINGTLGIGTRNATALLEINGTNLLNNLTLNVSGSLYVNGSLNNVGVGTPSPSYKLDVSGTVNAELLLINGTPLTSNITGSGTTGYIAQWANAGTLNNSIIYQNGTNVGIGTASPGAMLDISGSANVLGLNVNNTLYVNTTSNVGIGTSSPGNKLVVISDNISTAGLRVGGGNSRGTAHVTGGEMILGSSGANVGIFSYDIVNGYLYIDNGYDSDNAKILIRTKGNGGTPVNALTIIGNGNVGIGTNDPASKLHISGTNIVNNVTLNVNNTLYVNASGNVGIGTSSPSYKLDVSGTINANLLLINGTPLTSNITGSGTTGYIPQWANAGTLNNSIIYQNGTNLGIDTASPGAKLDISGSANVLGLNVNNTLYVNTTTSYVGIGTTNPGAKLELASGQLFVPSGSTLLPSITTSNDPDTGLSWEGGPGRLLVTVNGLSKVRFDSTRTTPGTDGDYDLGEVTGRWGNVYSVVGTFGTTPATAGTLRLPNTGDIEWRNAANSANFVGIAFGTDNNLQLMPSAGNVGIGTVTPSYRLDVNGTINALNVLINGSAIPGTGGSSGGWTNTSTVTSTTLDVNVTNSTGTLVLYVNTSSANVGIGTTSPTQKLHIVGSANITGDLYLNGSLFFGDGGSQGGTPVGNVSGGGSANYTARWSGVSSLESGSIYDNGNIGIGTANPGAKLHVTGSANVLALNVNNSLYVNTSTGYVGIGTTSPVSNLQVYGPISVGNYAEPSTTGDIRLSINSYIKFRNANSNGDILAFRFISDKIYVGTGIDMAGNIINDQTDVYDLGSSSLRWRNGYFATSITNPLLIGGTGTATNLTLRSTSGAGADIIFQTGNNGATEAMRILNNTNVGIGTMAPAYKLDVNGTINAQSFLINGTSLGNGNVTGSGTAGYIPQWQSNSLLNNSVIYQNGTNVGIGTTSPGDKFVIYNAGGVVSRVDGDTNTSAAYFAVRNFDGANSDKYIEFATFGSVVAGTSFGSVVANQTRLYSTGASSFAIGTGDAIPIILGTNNAAAMTILSGGNVGIGTTGPNSKLEVNGTVNITGGLNVTAGGMNVLSGNVGIGTTSPIDKLGVKGNLIIERTDSSEYMNISDRTGNPAITNVNPTSGAFPTFSIISQNNTGGQMIQAYFDNVGRVGLNSAGTVGARLDVENPGSDDITGFKLVHMSGSTQPYVAISKVGASAGSTFIIDLNGNVGINTTSPTSTLHVVGDINVTGNSYLNNLNIAGVTMASGTLNTSDDVNVGRNLNVARNFTVSNNLLFIDNLTGRAGVGTTAPTGKLHIFSSSNGIVPDSSADNLVIEEDSTAGVTIFGASTGSILFGDASSNAVGRIIYRHSTDALEFGAGGGSQQIVLTGGNVGVGTTSPQALLELNANNPQIYLNGSTSGTQVNAIRVVHTAAGTNDGGTAWHVYNGSVNTVNNRASIVMRRIGTASGNNAQGDYPIIFSTSAADALATEKLSISGNGNVGIGTTTPTGSLHVNSTSTSTPVQILQAALSQSESILQIRNYTGGTLSSIDSGGTRLSLSTNNGPMAAISMNSGTASTRDRMITFNSGAGEHGFIGITGAGGLRIGSDAGSDLVISQNTSAWSIGFDTNNTRRMTITSNGNIGINTTSPSQILSVVGNANITGTIYYGGNLTGYGADFAEMMYSDMPVEYGDVVCLNDKMHIVKCTSRAQNSVAGVVSATPTITGNAARGDVAVGIVGIVKTKVTGKVNRFDMLTTSSKAGYAEKATSSDFGAIIGKAMEPCDNTQGCMINVLVGLR